jgi:magnesium chelatase family protein
LNEECGIFIPHSFYLCAAVLLYFPFARTYKEKKLYSIVSTAIIQGIRSVPVQIEADVSDGMPVFEMVGFLTSEVKEAKERVRTALRNSGIVLPPKRITINFMPADIRKSGSAFDLPVAVAILSAMGIIPREEIESTFVVGEVGLDGKVQPIRGVLPMIAEAKDMGIRRCIVPLLNAKEAMLVDGIAIYGMASLEETIGFLTEGIYTGHDDEPGNDTYELPDSLPDFSEVRGQKLVKRACEVAVSGMHNLLMVGPPGSGKTMMAMRIPSILPPLDKEEQMEISKINSVNGTLDVGVGLVKNRPFRNPHHTISPQGLAGGGSLPKPGEISLAHKGVLFLDELPEFQNITLEILRQPLEEKKIRISRLSGTYEYPADFMLVAAMNPCKCGYYPDMQRCTCTQASIDRYLKKVSKPLLDRIDVCVETPRMEFGELMGDYISETSADIRERVIVTQRIQSERYAGMGFKFNSQIPSGKIDTYCTLTAHQKARMEEMYKRYNLTARTYHKILKVARTLADMDGADNISDDNLTEAFCYRSLDKKFWEGPM